MWETQRMLAQDQEVELVRQAERLNASSRDGSERTTWRQRLVRTVRVLLRQTPKPVPQQLPATND
jgi:hypothetical protein